MRNLNFISSWLQVEIHPAITLSNHIHLRGTGESLFIFHIKLLNSFEILNIWSRLTLML